MGAAGAVARRFGPLAGTGEAAGLAQRAPRGALQDAARRGRVELHVGERKRAETARNVFVGGQQMYVEYMIPAQVRHPFPVVLVHGGGGQGTDWMGTPDGRPGWFQYLVQEGYKVYVVDRPGHGRSPIHPDIHGGFPPTAMVLESLAGRFTPPSANPARRRTSTRRITPSGRAPAMSARRISISSRRARRKLRGAGASRRRPPAGGEPGADVKRARVAGRAGGGAPPADRRSREPGPGGPAECAAPGVASGRRRAARQDRPGDHHDPLGWRPVWSAGGRGAPEPGEGDGDHRGRGLGLRRRQPVGHVVHPGHVRPAGGGPVGDQDEVGARPEPGIAGYFLQEEPARKLPNLKNTKVLFVTAEASFASPGNPGGVAFLKQAGVYAEELRLARSASRATAT